MNIVNMLNSREFFPLGKDDLTREYFVYCKKNWRSTVEKAPLFGRFDMFQTRHRGPKTKEGACA